MYFLPTYSFPDTQKYLLHFECLAGQENGPILALIKSTSLVIHTVADLVDSLNTNALFVPSGLKRNVKLFRLYLYLQWGEKVFSQPPIVQVLALRKMREACNFHHRYTSNMTDKIRKKIQRITL
jgi:hypothetical protein